MKRIALLMIIGILISSALSVPYLKMGIVSAAPSTSYYVANDGDDSNDGLSPATAWQTISKVNSELGGLISQGDDIYFNRGDTWSGTTLSLALGGNESNPMIFGAYGSGAKPQFSRSGSQFIYQTGSLSWITFQDWDLRSSSNAIIFEENCNCNYIRFKNITYGNGAGNFILASLNHYLIENCDFSGGSACAIQGSLNNRIRNGIVRNCTFASTSDGLTFHYSGDISQNKFVGENHWVDNCSGYGTTENAFDITSGGNYYISNCTGYNSGMGSMFLAHEVKNVTIHNYHGYGTGGSQFTTTECNNTIFRYSTIEDYGTRGMYLGSDNSDSGDYTQNICIYNSVISYERTATEQLQSDEDFINANFRNNIFYSNAQSSPGLCVDIGNADGYNTFENINSNWSNNLWWRGDGLTGSHWQDDAGSYTWSQWTLKDVTFGDIRDNPEFADITNDDYTLNATSPCIDAGAWLTKTNGGGTGTTITLDEANYFFGGLSGLGINSEDINGDSVFIGNDKNLRITAVDYSADTITVNRSITWIDCSRYRCL